jgi:CIC family chloride channel protein
LPFSIFTSSTLPDASVGTPFSQPMVAFDNAEAEALAVIQSRESRHVIGLLSEAHALRRYSEELELRRRELIGE